MGTVPVRACRIAGVAKPVATKGIETLDIRKGNKSVNSVHKDDLPIRDALYAATEKVIHLPRLICEAGQNQGSTRGEVRANDPERARIQ